MVRLQSQRMDRNRVKPNLPRMPKMTAQILIDCPCGEQHRYSNLQTAMAIDEIIEREGEEITLTIAETNKSYLVNRHYIAFHGIKAKDLKSLADRGIIKRTESS